MKLFIHLFLIFKYIYLYIKISYNNYIKFIINTFITFLIKILQIYQNCLIINFITEYLIL
jgi:hypothetical protein